MWEGVGTTFELAFRAPDSEESFHGIHFSSVDWALSSFCVCQPSLCKHTENISWVLVMWCSVLNATGLLSKFIRWSVIRIRPLRVVSNSDLQIAAALWGFTCVIWVVRIILQDWRCVYVCCCYFDYKNKKFRFMEVQKLVYIVWLKLMTYIFWFQISYPLIWNCIELKWLKSNVVLKGAGIILDAVVKELIRVGCGFLKIENLL